MKEFVIGKGIPVPDKIFGSGTGLLGNVRKMEVGDSIFIAAGKYQTIAATGRIVFQEIGSRFTTRKVEGGICIWRVS